MNLGWLQLRKKMNWIKCAHEMPKQDEWIIVGSSVYAAVSIGILMGDTFVNPDMDYFVIKGITHWMPLPEPPNEQVSNPD